MTASESSRIVSGPEFNDSGDPAWIEPPLAVGYALPGDQYTGYGRWRERIFPTETHLADKNPLTIGRVGLRRALARLDEVLSPSTQSPENPVTPNEDELVSAMVGLYDSLEWIHSLNEHVVKIGRYRNPSDLHAALGAMVNGAVAARNASHHGLRRVVGIVEVPRAIYQATTNRWVHTGTYDSSRPDLQVRWVEKLPMRSEPGEDQVKALFSAKQERDFTEYLAGREVRHTIRLVFEFFLYTIDGKTAPPNLYFGPATNPPMIDPTANL